MSAGRILLVEDEPNMRELVAARLEQNGYEVATAADGYQALARARDFSPDLVILDLMIPKLDGYTVCYLLRSGPSSSVPIIMLTARSAPEDVQRGMDTGASAYLLKPVDPAVLLAKIEELLKAKTAPPPPAEEKKPS
ncbi:MAG: response regulator [candidate division WOR-3 bacterium]